MEMSQIFELVRGWMDENSGNGDSGAAAGGTDLP